jgi:hypothetical protein
MTHFWLTLTLNNGSILELAVLVCNSLNNTMTRHSLALNTYEVTKKYHFIHYSHLYAHIQNNMFATYLVCDKEAGSGGGGGHLNYADYFLLEYGSLFKPLSSFTCDTRRAPISWSQLLRAG